MPNPHDSFFFNFYMENIEFKSSEVQFPRLELGSKLKECYSEVKNIETYWNLK